jgi:hypothetical protein
MLGRPDHCRKLSGCSPPITSSIIPERSAGDGDLLGLDGHPPQNGVSDFLRF